MSAMPATRTTTGAIMRRTAAARDPIPPKSRRRIQVPRTPEVDPEDEETARLEALIRAAEKAQHNKRLEERLARIQRGETGDETISAPIVGASANSTQRLEQEPEGGGGIPLFTLVRIHVFFS